MRRMFVTGDTHGRFNFLEPFCEEFNTTTEDILIILGDAGINYYGCTSKKEEKLKKFIASQPITLFCIRGNHEDRPEDRPEYTLKDMGIGDKVYQSLTYPNIWFAQDGGEYMICNQSILTVGGAYSVDKFFRIINGHKWVANEMLTSDEIAQVLDTCYHKHYNHIMTHTCPISVEPTDLFLSGIDQNTVPKDMERGLEMVARYATFDTWWFGHYHDNRVTADKYHMLFDEIWEIQENDSHYIGNQFTLNWKYERSHPECFF